jgi:rod shape-determining protein MreC
MAFAGGGLNRPSSRDSAAGPRFFFFAVLSVVLMYYDQQGGWSEKLRYGLQAAAYPVQVAVGSPRKLWSGLSDFFTSRDTLRAENEVLRKHEQELSLTTLRFTAMEQENARLRALTKSLPPLVKRSLLADVVNADLGRLRQRLVLNKGDRNELYRSQPAVDEHGLLGQLVRVGPWSAEVMLITDPEHAVPVEIARNGLRSIALGTGNDTELSLPYFPANADVKTGDLLITSGLGGVFPAGYPVATITEVIHDPDLILARVRAQPAATMAGDRQVMMLWFDAANPAAPIDPKLAEQLPPAVLASPVLASPVPAPREAPRGAPSASPPAATRSTP